ncbi:MAG: IS1380 family transposase [Alphaproteobacteria bacterium]|nr:IS1380 family transposase [Alphaproteobacteria bacterium]
MGTRCNPSKLCFHASGRRAVQAAFDAPAVTSDAGLLLLREVATSMALFELAAECFTDFRDPDRIEHSVESLLAQRVLALACGYEDLNDHTWLQQDPLFAVAIGKDDPLGVTRRRAGDRGRALASPATLNRLENTPAEIADARADQRLVHDPEALRDLFVDLAMDGQETTPHEVVLDLDATDDRVHGKQEGRFFHGYYDSYCFLPLYVFWGDRLLAAELRPANQDGAAGTLEVVQRIVGKLRQRWPGVHVIVRADSGFSRDWLMAWCEATPGVDFVLGLARNQRLSPMLAPEMARMQRRVEETGVPHRCFKELRYRTLDSWSAERRVIGKAEVTGDKENPRFVVTSIPIEEADATAIYAFYCQRGEMENRIKGQQLDLFADRTSAHRFRANQLRLWFASLAYVLIDELRRRGLADTELARAHAGTIRLRLLKLGAVVKVSVRRVMISMSSAFPLQDLFQDVLERLRRSFRLPLLC